RAVARLAEEDLLLAAGCAQAAAVDCASSADFACAASSANAAGSRAAMSASTLRSSSTFAAFMPAMNWLYERPLARAPALMRMIQSRRKARLRFFRSRYA